MPGGVIGDGGSEIPRGLEALSTGLSTGERVFVRTRVRRSIGPRTRVRSRLLLLATSATLGKSRAVVLRAPWVAAVGPPSSVLRVGRGWPRAAVWAVWRPWVAAVGAWAVCGRVGRPPWVLRPWVLRVGPPWPRVRPIVLRAPWVAAVGAWAVGGRVGGPPWPRLRRAMPRHRQAFRGAFARGRRDRSRGRGRCHAPRTRGHRVTYN